MREGAAAGHSRQRGLSLVELLATLAVVGVLTGLMLPDLRRLVAETEATTHGRSIVAAIGYARSVAATGGDATVVCPLDAASGRCNGAWSGGFALFPDRDEDARRDPGEPVLRRFEGVPAGASLVFRAFRTGRYLRILPNGQTDWQNGRFVYCPPPESRAAPRVVVINVQGRVRTAEIRRTAAGFVEAAGRAVPCG